MFSENHPAGSGRAIATSGYPALGDKQVSGWLTGMPPTWSTLRCCEKESTAKPHRYCSDQRKKHPEQNILPFLTGNSAPLESYGTTVVYAVHHWRKRYVAHDCTMGWMINTPSHPPNELGHPSLARCHHLHKHTLFYSKSSPLLPSTNTLTILVCHRDEAPEMGDTGMRPQKCWGPPNGRRDGRGAHLNSQTAGSGRTLQQQVEKVGAQRETGALEGGGSSSAIGKERGPPHPGAKGTRGRGVTLVHTPSPTPGGLGRGRLLCPLLSP